MAKESIETLVLELTHEEEWRRMRATAACLAGGPRAVKALVPPRGEATYKIEAGAGSTRIVILQPDVFWQEKHLAVIAK